MRLDATNARAARSEAASKFPRGCTLRGYDDENVCVYISMVRPSGDKHPVASAFSNSGTRSTHFEAFSLEPSPPVKILIPNRLLSVVADELTRALQDAHEDSELQRTWPSDHGYDTFEEMREAIEALIKELRA